MTDRPHKLQSRFDRLPERIDGPVVDGIVVYERSGGRLRLPGEYSTDDRPPRHHCQVSATNRDRCEIEEVQLGDPGHYRVIFKVWNYNDSPAFVDLVLDAEEAADGQA